MKLRSHKVYGHPTGRLLSIAAVQCILSETTSYLLNLGERYRYIYIYIDESFTLGGSFPGATFVDLT